VLNPRFELMICRHIDFGSGAYRSRRILRDLAGFAESPVAANSTSSHFATCRVTPNVAISWSRVAWNQFPLLIHKRRI